MHSEMAARLGLPADHRAIKPLLHALSEASSSTRYYALIALGELGDKGVIDALIPLLQDEDEKVRAKTAEVLGVLGEQRVVEQLIYILDDKSELVREKTIEALGKIGGDLAVEFLISNLEIPDYDMRYFAARALAKFDDKEVIATLVPFFKEGNIDPLRMIRDWVKFGTVVVLPLIELLDSKDSHVRWLAAEALADIGDERAIEPLLKLLEDENGEVSSQAGTSLTRFGDRVVPQLIKALSNPDNFTRWSAAYALGEIGDFRALPALKLIEQENEGRTYQDKRFKEIASKAAGRIIAAKRG